MNCIVTHENNLVADGRLGKFYKYVNNKLNGSNGIGPLKSPSGEMLYSDCDKAVLLNDYLSSCMRRFLRSSGSDANGKKNFVDDGLDMNVNLCFTNKQFDVINKKNRHKTVQVNTLMFVNRTAFCTRRLATANRSRISTRGRPSKNFLTSSSITRQIPVIVSRILCSPKWQSQKLEGSWGSALFGRWGVAGPRVTIPNFVAIGQIGWASVRGSKNLGTLGPPLD